MTYFVLILLYVSSVSMNSLAAEEAGPGYVTPLHVQYSFTLQNRTNKGLQDVQFWTYAPVKQTATQKCTTINTSHPYTMVIDKYGNQVLNFTFKKFPPYATRLITINADLLMSDTPNIMPAENMENYLKPEKYIESDNPEIIKKAMVLRKDNTLDTARNIFNWVSGSIQYSGYQKRDLGALYAFSKKKGDCTEYMYLFAALCRGNNIPSRCISGYVCQNNTVLKPADFHNWAEFYEKDRWYLADPQKRVFMKDASAYVIMQVINRNEDNPMKGHSRFRIKGDGIKVRMN